MFLGRNSICCATKPLRRNFDADQQPDPGQSRSEHARSQVKGGHSSGEIELIQACDWLTADNTLDFQRELYINKVFGISRRKFDTFYTETD